MSDHHLLQFWDFEDAPANLKRFVPRSYAGGWVGFISSGRSSEVLAILVALMKSSGFRFVCCETGDGVVIAGPHVTYQ